MSDKGPVTRKRTRQVDATERAVTRDRRPGGDWKDGPSRHPRGEENDKGSSGGDKKKKLVTPIPTNIPGVSSVIKGDARLDIREIEAVCEMMPSEKDDAPGAARATPAPPLSKSSREMSKRRRFAAWMKDPKSIQSELDAQKDALARALTEDAMVEGEREEWERWFMIMREHLIAARRPAISLSARSPEALTSAPSSSSSQEGEDEESEEEGEDEGNSKASSPSNKDSSAAEKAAGSAISAAILAASGNTPNTATSNANASPVSSARTGRDSSDSSKGAAVARAAGAGAVPSAAQADEGEESDDLDGDVPVVDVADPANPTKATSATAGRDDNDAKSSSVTPAASSTTNKAADGGVSGVCIRTSGRKSRKKRQGSGAGSGYNGDVDNDQEKDKGGASKNEGETAVVSSARSGRRRWKEEERVRELQRLAMKRAGLEGDFDMAKVVGVLTSRSREVMQARREKRHLLAEQQRQQAAHDGVEDTNTDQAPPPPPSSQERSGSSTANAVGTTDLGSGAAKHAPDDLEERASPHPDDEDVLRKWKALLHSAGERCATASDGLLWRERVFIGGSGGGGGANAGDDSLEIALRECGVDQIRRGGGGGGGGAGSQQSRKLLVPRGFDLLPSMRVPLRPRTATLAAANSSVKEANHSVFSTGAPDMPGGAEAVPEDARGDAVEWVPWIAGAQRAAKFGEGKELAECAGLNSGAGGAKARAFRDRMQWFPRGLPLEVQSAMVKDERESALYNTRAAVAIDRLREAVADTAKRQREMEAKRREKAEEAVRLVRAAADHERLRKAHQKKVAALKARLRKLEEANGLNADDVMEEADDTSAEEGPAADGDTTSANNVNRGKTGSASASGNTFGGGGNFGGGSGISMRSRSRSPISNFHSAAASTFGSTAAPALVANGQKDETAMSLSPSSSSSSSSSSNNNNSNSDRPRSSSSGKYSDNEDNDSGTNNTTTTPAGIGEFTRGRGATTRGDGSVAAARAGRGKSNDIDHFSSAESDDDGPAPVTGLSTSSKSALAAPVIATRETRERALRGGVGGASAAISGGAAAGAAGREGASTADSVLGKREAAVSAGGNAKRPATEASRDKDVESGAGDKKRAAAATAGVASSGAAAVAAGRTGVKRRRSGDLSGISLPKPTSPRVSVEGPGSGSPRSANGDTVVQSTSLPPTPNEGGGRGASTRDAAASGSSDKKAGRPRPSEKKGRGRPKGTSSRSR